MKAQCADAPLVRSCCEASDVRAVIGFREIKPMMLPAISLRGFRVEREFFNVP